MIRKYMTLPLLKEPISLPLLVPMDLFGCSICGQRTLQTIFILQLADVVFTGLSNIPQYCTKLLLQIDYLYFAWDGTNRILIYWLR